MLFFTGRKGLIGKKKRVAESEIITTKKRIGNLLTKKEVENMQPKPVARNRQSRTEGKSLRFCRIKKKKRYRL